MMRNDVKGRPTTAQKASPPVYPFTAIVGQEEMKLALLLSVVEPAIGGVLIFGHRGTAKSTAVRALAELLPPLTRVAGCPFNCDPEDNASLCEDCRARLQMRARLPRERVRVPVVSLPLNATEDRLCGTLNLERALREGARSFEPGLLARAHRGFLYIDEVNLLEDHLVDLLLDAAATGRNRVEREGVSAEHAARFVLVGSGNPEEGELRPQLLDRFGLCVEVRTAESLDERVRVVERREAYERDPAGFAAAHEEEQAALRRRLTRARRSVADVRVPPELIRRAAELCLRLKTDGHRGELTIVRAARALAALEGRREANDGDVRRVAALALGHRLRTDPLEETEGGARVRQLADEIFGADSAARDGRGERGSGAKGKGRKSSDEGRRTSDEGQRSSDARDGEDSSGGGEPRGARRVEFGGAGDNSSGEGRRNSSGEDGRAGHTRGKSRPAPPADATLPSDLSATESRGRRKASPFAAQSRGGSRSRTTNAPRGRYVRADSTRPGSSPRLAVDSTLRASALRHAAQRVATSEAGRTITADDLRFKRFSRKEGTLFICAVDASGSMAVNRIRQAKGALARLLRRSYVRRDRVALISFRERGAELLLRPSQSVALAKRRLDALAVGGATPLAGGLLRALEVARGAAKRGTRRIALLVFTDGRANVALDGHGGDDGAARAARIACEIELLGASLRRLGVTSVVIDTRRGFGARGEGQTLARALGGRYVRLPVSGEGELPELIH